jgi:hypothetical protein
VADRRGRDAQSAGDRADAEPSLHELAQRVAVDPTARRMAHGVHRGEVVLVDPIRDARRMSADTARDRLDGSAGAQLLFEPIAFHPPEH